ncbi:MAG: hypothetical protein HZB62_01640 [Nitrospirae bacterium]|nr:hypothetical protein [Nitrospirota bacterium]
MMAFGEVISAIASKVDLKKTMKGFAAFLVVFSIIGFLILPPIIKSVLLKQLFDRAEHAPA